MAQPLQQLIDKFPNKSQSQRPQKATRRLRPRYCDTTCGAALALLLLAAAASAVHNWPSRSSLISPRHVSPKFMNSYGPYRLRRQVLHCDGPGESYIRRSGRFGTWIGWSQREAGSSAKASPVTTVGRRRSVGDKSFRQI